MPEHATELAAVGFGESGVSSKLLSQDIAFVQHQA